MGGIEPYFFILKWPKLITKLISIYKFVYLPVIYSCSVNLPLINDGETVCECVPVNIPTCQEVCIRVCVHVGERVYMLVRASVRLCTCSCVCV